MPIVPSTEIAHRDDFALLATWRHLRKVVEIGVELGNFAETFLSRAYSNLQYIGVDPYQPYWEDPYDRVADQVIAASKFAKYRTARLVVATGPTVAESIRKREFGPIKEGRVDFVYIDALHEYDAVKADMADWWDLLSDHGILAGHDFDKSHPGVIQAVTEFVDTKGLTAYITWDDSPCYSWYIYKTARPDNWKRCIPTMRQLARLPI